MTAYDATMNKTRVFSCNPTLNAKLQWLKTNIVEPNSGASEAQGTSGWLAKRRRAIGGSEMGSLFKIFTEMNAGTPDCENRELLTMMISKCGLSSFKNNFHCDWGHLFEPVAQLFLEQLFNCPIYETGSIPSPVMEGTSYSPDGFAVIETSRIMKLIADGVLPKHVLPSGETAINALFEIKSPSRRTPTDRVPNNYIYQPLSGLCHFKWLDIAYFADFVFRKTSYQSFTSHDTKDYDTQYHSTCKKSLTYPIGYGMILVYGASEFSHSLVDVGAQSFTSFNNTMRAIRTGALKAYYHPPMQAYHGDPAAYAAAVINASKLFRSQNVYGYLFYKIFDVKIIPMQRDDERVMKMASCAKKVAKWFNNINDICDSKEEKIAALCEAFHKISANRSDLCIESDVDSEEPLSELARPIAEMDTDGLF